jgi:2-oxoglutarate ferredoxin oxidoreductase subunit delta
VSGSIQIEKERCKGCSLCVESCARDCISLSEELNLKGYFVAAFDESGDCNACRNCALMCPDACIEVSKG